MARYFYANVEGEAMNNFVDIIDRKEMLYLEMARAEINYGSCVVRALFHHTLLKKNVFWADLMIICFEAGRIVSVLNIRHGLDIVVHHDIEDALKQQMENVFGQFFFSRPKI